MIAAGGEVTYVAPRFITITQHFIEAAAALLERKQATSDEALSGIDLFNRFKADAESLRNREEAILVNPRLSAVGRVEELAKVYKAFERDSRYIRDGAETRKRTALDLRDRLLATPKPTGNETVEELRGTEVRRRLAKLPMNERRQILLNAMATGNVHVLRAVEMDPFVFVEKDPLIEPEFLHRIKEERAQKHENGKEWMRLQSLLFVSERLEQLAMAIDLQLSNYGTIPSFQGRETRTSEMIFPDSQAPPAKSAADQPPDSQPRFQ